MAKSKLEAAELIPDTQEPQESQTTIKVEATESVIYIGASFKGVATGTVFKDGKLIPALENAVKAMPAIRELIVPVSKLVEARRQLQNKDSALSRCYEITRNYTKGE